MDVAALAKEFRLASKVLCTRDGRRANWRRSNGQGVGGR